MCNLDTWGFKFSKEEMKVYKTQRFTQKKIPMERKTQIGIKLLYFIDSVKVAFQVKMAFSSMQ